MSDRYDVSYTSSAVDDLHRIHDYVADELHAPVAAARLLTKIRDAIRSLEHMPLRHALASRTALASKGVRLMHVGNHVVLYHVDEAARALTVIRVVYGGRSLSRIARELA